MMKNIFKFYFEMTMLENKVYICTKSLSSEVGFLKTKVMRSGKINPKIELFIPPIKLIKICNSPVNFHSYLYADKFVLYAFMCIM